MPVQCQCQRSIGSEYDQKAVSARGVFVQLKNSDSAFEPRSFTINDCVKAAMWLLEKDQDEDEGCQATCDTHRSHLLWQSETTENTDQLDSSIGHLHWSVNCPKRRVPLIKPGECVRGRYVEILSNVREPFVFTPRPRHDVMCPEPQPYFDVFVPAPDPRHKKMYLITAVCNDDIMKLSISKKISAVLSSIGFPQARPHQTRPVASNPLACSFVVAICSCGILTDITSPTNVV